MSALPRGRMTGARWLLAACLAGMPCAMWAAAHALYAAGWRVNWTASEPRGVYRLRPIDASGDDLRGQLIAFCPPPWVSPSAFPFYARGACPGGGEPMVKTIVGVPGDVVSLSSEGVTINGRRLPASAPRRLAGTGVALPRLRGTIKLAPGMFWMYGQGEDARAASESFDSRYWGPVAIGEVRGVLVAQWVQSPGARG